MLRKALIVAAVLGASVPAFAQQPDPKADANKVQPGTAPTDAAGAKPGEAGTGKPASPGATSQGANVKVTPGKEGQGPTDAVSGQNSGSGSSSTGGTPAPSK